MFIDETGFLMHPVVRRTWAPRGNSPVLRPQTRSHRKISAIGGISISPHRRRLGGYLPFHRDDSIRQEQILAFRRHPLRHLRGPVLGVWDCLGAHRGARVRAYAAGQPRLRLELLPAYAPEPNANEYGWSHLKYGTLANFCPHDLDELETGVFVAAVGTQSREALLRSFVHATELPIRL